MALQVSEARFTSGTEKPNATSGSMASQEPAVAECRIARCFTDETWDGRKA